MTKLFSQRYGYTSLADVIIREAMPEAIQNAICNCYDKMPDANIPDHDVGGCVGVKNALTEYLWCNYLNNRAEELYEKYRYGENIDVFIETLLDNDYPWYLKLDMIEMSLAYLFGVYKENSYCFEESPAVFEKNLNKELARLNYAYRIIDHKIVEIISNIEIDCIEQAIDGSDNRIKMHLSSALSLLSKRPEGDYRNSIKESISAVEVWCRARTKENDLRSALNKLESKGIIIHSQLHEAFNKLYDYSNNKETGIRHALMDDEGTYTPTKDESIYMIVTCSAFINYLNKKLTML